MRAAARYPWVRAALFLAAALIVQLALSGCGGANVRPIASKTTSETSAQIERTWESPTAPAQTGTAEPPLLSGTVIRVVDGDTAHVRMADGHTEKVRFIGIDTPESTREIEPYGKEASRYTRKALQGRHVYLERDVEERDRYERMLAYIWTERPVSRSDAELRAKLFNARLLLDGYAQVYTFPPNVRYVDFFLGCQREARAAGRGLWAIDSSTEPSSKSGFVASAKREVFHRPDCSWARKISPDNVIRFSSRNAAVDSGRRACGVCDP